MQTYLWHLATAKRPEPTKSEQRSRCALCTICGFEFNAVLRPQRPCKPDYLGRGAQDGRFDFHTAPELCQSLVLLKCCFTSTETRKRRFIRNGSPGRPPRLSHSSWTLVSLWSEWADCICTWSPCILWEPFTAQELCESRGGRPGLPVPKSPYGLCGRKATIILNVGTLQNPGGRPGLSVPNKSVRSLWP